jgi:hypothetical protein
MTSPAAPWQFKYDVSPTLPPLAWLATIDKLTVNARCGSSVRITDQGFFEGTWSGPPGLDSIARQETIFGSGIVIDGRNLVIVTPAHILESLFMAHESDGRLLVSNSLVCLLVATGRQLREDVLYPPVFSAINRGLSHATIEVPTTTAPLINQYFENIVVNVDNSLTVRPKPRGKPPTGYADYAAMVSDRVASAFANAAQYGPVVAMSTGYDSTASAAVAARFGCTEAFSFRSGWPWAGYFGEDDYPDVAARALGLEVHVFERMAYQDCDDQPEAEFLATGLSGEDVVYRSMEPALHKRLMVSGFWGGGAWRGNDRPNLMRTDLSGASMAEFRVRMDMLHLPLPYIGAIHQRDLARIRKSDEMLPWRVGGVYDEPVARRLAEEAGVPRGSFGVQKRATSHRIHVMGLDALSPSGRASFEAFAGSDALRDLPRKKTMTPFHRVWMKTAHRLHADWAAAPVHDRRLAAVHLEPVLGSLLLRWAVQLTRPRYAEVAPDR